MQHILIALIAPILLKATSSTSTSFPDNGILSPKLAQDLRKFPFAASHDILHLRTQLEQLEYQILASNMQDPMHENIHREWEAACSSIYAGLASGIAFNQHVLTRMLEIEGILEKISPRYTSRLEKLIVRKRINNPYLLDERAIIDQALGQRRLELATIRQLVSMPTCYKVNEVLRLGVWDFSPELLYITRICKQDLSVHSKSVLIPFMLKQMETGRSLPSAEIHIGNYERTGSLFRKAVDHLSGLDSSTLNISELIVRTSKGVLPLSPFVSHALFSITSPEFFRDENGLLKPSNIPLTNGVVKTLRQVGRLIGLAIFHKIAVFVPFHPDCLRVITTYSPETLVHSDGESSRMNFVIEGIYEVLPFGLLNWWSARDLEVRLTSLEYKPDLMRLVESFSFDPKLDKSTREWFTQYMYGLDNLTRTRFLLKALGSTQIEGKIYVKMGNDLVVGFDALNSAIIVGKQYRSYGHFIDTLYKAICS
jgi:hypothetical protein